MRLGAALPWGRKDTALPPNEQSTPVRALEQKSLRCGRRPPCSGPHPALGSLRGPVDSAFHKVL